jgi:hypothetical protein
LSALKYLILEVVLGVVEIEFVSLHGSLEFFKVDVHLAHLLLWVL